jgi:hypothetical protein
VPQSPRQTVIPASNPQARQGSIRFPFPLPQRFSSSLPSTKRPPNTLILQSLVSSSKSSEELESKPLSYVSYPFHLFSFPPISWGPFLTTSIFFFFFSSFHQTTSFLLHPTIITTLTSWVVAATTDHPRHQSKPRRQEAPHCQRPHNTIPPFHLMFNPTPTNTTTDASMGRGGYN